MAATLAPQLAVVAEREVRQTRRPARGAPDWTVETWHSGGGRPPRPDALAACRRGSPALPGRPFSGRPLASPPRAYSAGPRPVSSRPAPPRSANVAHGYNPSSLAGLSLTSLARRT